jgi:hypothetical protein
VVASGLHRIGAAGEEALAVVMDRRDLAVDRLLAADDFRTESLADGLMAEADAEERDGGVEADEIENAAGAGGGAGAGRNDDGSGALGEERGGLEGVVADDAQRLAGQPLDLLDEIPGEGIVVVDDGDRSGAQERIRAKETRRQCGRSSRAPGRFDADSWRRRITQVESCIRRERAIDHPQLIKTAFGWSWPACRKSDAAIR